VRLLLDTHTLLWYALNDPHLSGTAESAILDPASQVFVSPASYWELAIKISIGKLALQRRFEDFLDACEYQYRFEVLPITAAHAAQVATLPFPGTHRDPFDRLLIAQAIVEQMPVVTGDPEFDEYPVKRIW
jgi:PIN domain nuclease of toxin-antitoxin system